MNRNIKSVVKESGYPQWKIANEIGVTEFTLIRWLRVPEKLEASKIEAIEKAINKLDGVNK